MSSISIAGDTSGAVTLAAPAIAGTNTITLPAGTGTMAVQGASTNIVSGTVNAGGANPFNNTLTAVDFTSIPSWVKRITVMFSGVSTSGTSYKLIQLGDSGGIETTGYVSTGGQIDGTPGTVNSTAGIIIVSQLAADVLDGAVIFTSLNTSNTWVCHGTVSNATNQLSMIAGSKALSDTLTQVRITTVGGTDTFDAGSINILYE